MPEIVTFQEAITAGRKGMTETQKETISKVATAAVEAGLCMVPGATDPLCKVVAVAGDVVKALGFSVYQPMKSAAATGEEYAALDVVEILREGVMWVQCETAAVPGGQVFVRHAAPGAGEKIGATRNDADTADATLLPGAKFASTKVGVALGIVKVILNLPAN